MTDEVAQAPQPEQATPAVASENNAAPQAANTETPASSETSGDDAAATDQPERKKRDGGFQRRINELTRAAHEKQRVIDHLLEQQRANTGRPAAADAPTGAEPKQEDFASYDQWQNALIDHRLNAKLEQRERERRETEERGKAERTAAERQASLRKAAEQAADKYPDFEDALESSDIPITQAMADAIDESERKVDLLWWLAKNPEEAKRIAGLSPVSQARTLARIEFEKLASAQPQKTVSDAPEPPRTVKGKGQPAPNPDKMTMPEYIEWRARNGG